MRKGKSNMKVAIITGASSGIGEEFVFQIDQACNDLDEIWVIARRVEQTEYPVTKARIVRLPLDLTSKEAQQVLEEKLAYEEPRIKLLINCAGFGKIGRFEDISLDMQCNMMECNAIALMKMCHLCIPYIIKGGYILNMASAAAFLPQIRFAVYAASKSFVLSFSRALNYELRDRRISVTAVCPGPVKTHFFDIAEETGYTLFIKKIFMAKTEKVVKYALQCARERRQVSVYGIPMKALHLISKVLPHRLVLELYDLIL